MGTVSSGIGLISGLNIQQLVDSLIATRSRPVDLLKSRIQQGTAVRTAYLDLSARLLALKSTFSKLNSTDAFRAAEATSSNENTLTATAGTSATPGSYVFTVRSLAASQQLISSGFASRDASFLTPGRLTFERNDARLDRGTALGSLNGGAGVRTGKIRITDRAGGSAQIDLTTAQSVSDVLTAINGQSTAAVRATVEGDRIVLTDQTGAAAGSVVVEDLGGGSAALDLGIRGSSATGRLEGGDVVRLSATTQLTALRDGNGIRVHGVSDDFRVTLADGSAVDVNLSGKLRNDLSLAGLNGGGGVPAGKILAKNRAGQTAEIDLAGAQTVGDVVNAIQGAGLNLTVTIVGAKFVVTDGSTGDGTLSFAEVGNGTTATALGLTTAAIGNSLTGRDVYRVATIGDALREINLDSQNAGRLSAEISPDGDRIRLIDQTSGAGAISVSALSDSSAASDLGLLRDGSGGAIVSGRLNSGLNSVLLRSLNGGSGVGSGVIQITDRTGASANVDLTGAETLDDVIRGINSAGVGVVARVSASGLGIEVADTSGGTANLKIADVSGELARGLGITVDAAVGQVSKANLQRQYVSESTRLDSFRSSIAFSRGKFRITDSTGASAVVDLTQGDEKTIGAVIAEVNSRGIGVRASINANGDGLLLTDTAGGSALMTVSEEGGSTAKSLGILGSAATGTTTIDGSLERGIDVLATDTLDTLIDKIRGSGAAVNASLLNDGNSANPYRLSLASTQSGESGRLAIDVGATGLSLATLVEGRDAKVLFGPPDSTQPLVLTSATNTLADAIPGVSLNLLAASDQPVTVNVARSADTPAAALKAFVDGYNAIADRITELTKFNSETNQRGLLLGDATVERIQSRLASLVTKRATNGSAGFDRLSSVGVTVSSGGKLSFDEDRFRAQYDANPQAVETLFADATSGLAATFDAQFDQMTNDDTGILPRAEESLGKTLDLLSDRQAALEASLEKQRAQLMAKFQASEQVLAQLQSQQSALTGFKSVTAT